MPGARSGAATASPRTSRTGQSPAQHSREILGLVLGRPGEDLGGDLKERECQDRSLAQLVGRRSADSSEAPREHLVHQRVEYLLFVLGSRQERRAPVSDHGPVVHRMVEGGTGQHESVDDGDLQGHFHPGLAGGDPRQMRARRRVEEHRGTDAYRVLPGRPLF